MWARIYWFYIIHLGKKSYISIVNQRPFLISHFLHHPPPPPTPKTLFNIIGLAKQRNCIGLANHDPKPTLPTNYSQLPAADQTTIRDCVIPDERPERRCRHVHCTSGVDLARNTLVATRYSGVEHLHYSPWFLFLVVIITSSCGMNFRRIILQTLDIEIRESKTI